MDSERIRTWQAADRLFSDWLELDAGARTGWLARQSAAADVLGALQSLIAGHEAGSEAPSVFDRLGGIGAADAPPRNQLAGRRVGAWELLGEIGRGGMSVVYRARRGDVDFEQQAAVKLLGMMALGSLGSERFEHERRALARLRHAHIAPLIDGGFSEDGTPFLVMPLIEGLDLARYCRQRAPSWQARVRLLIQVCDAVAHAHRNLLVHRDLKPSNIVVSDEGVPILLDFGIAKLLDTDSEATRTGLRAMTPGYAAPEQISGDAITTATDVHALGVMLGELCGADPDIPRDLRNIIAMATRAEPERRYPDARALGEDLERLLDARPVRATPDSAGYRLRAFLRRRRGTVAALTAILLVLLGGLLTTTWQARRAEHQASEALRQSARAEATRDFLFDLFGAADREQAGAEDPRVSSLVERGAARLQEFANQPELHAEMATLLGRIDTATGQHARARELLDAAERNASRSGDRSLLAQVRLGQARLANAEGDPERALGLFEGAWTLRQQDDAGDSSFRVAVLSGQIYAMQNLGREAEARQLLTGELARPEPIHQPAQRGELLLGLASLVLDSGEKLDLLRQAEQQFSLQAPPPATRMGLESELATAAMGAGAIEPSLRHGLRAVELADRLYPGASSKRARIRNNYGNILRRAGRLAEANTAYATAESIYRALGDQRSPAFAALLHNRGVLLNDLGDPQGAVPLLELAVELATEQFGASDRRSGLALRHLAMVRAAASGDPQADIEWQRAHEIGAAASARVRYDLLLIGARIALDLGRPSAASERLREADALSDAETDTLELRTEQRIRRHTLEGALQSTRGNSQAALDAFAAARELATESPDRWRIELAAGEHHDRTRTYADARARYSAALGLLLAIGADERASRVVALRERIKALNPGSQGS
jgi:serine/threonine-protein kinase